jgi:ribosomal protein S18 acetylase RimI-like enzyme
MAAPHLREATPDDLPAIRRFERAYIADTEPEALDGWERAADRNLRLWTSCLPRTVVLEELGGDGPAPLGYVMWSSDGGSATLVSIQVDPSHRRRGLGRRLLAEFERRATADGDVLALLGVHERNPARALYERAGYEPTGREGSYLLYQHRLVGHG